VSIRKCKPGEKDKYIVSKRAQKTAALEDAKKIGDIVLEGRVAAEHARTPGSYKFLTTECVNERPVYSLTDSTGKRVFLFSDETGMWRVCDNASHMRMGKAEGKLAVASMAVNPMQITGTWREICTKTGAWPESPHLCARASSPSVMSVKQLKKFIELSGMSSAQCVEKSDLQRVAWEIVKKKGGAVLADQTSQRNNATSAAAAPSKQPMKVAANISPLVRLTSHRWV
jgi:hypothetical protein